jgi:hypothetical protein
MSLTAPSPRRFVQVVRAVVLALTSVALAVVCLEWARRRQVFGLPWNAESPNLEIIYLRGILLFCSILTLWIFRTTLGFGINLSRRQHLWLQWGMGYTPWSRF